MIPVNMKSYSKHFGFIRNKAIAAEIISLDPVKDHCRIVHLMTGYEFPWDVVRALEVALMRTFCSPCISGLLHRTGEFRKHGQKRYDDTALLVAEFMQNGYDNERGKFAVEHMNKIHRFYKIENDDFLFVLLYFCLFNGLIAMAGEKQLLQKEKRYFIFLRKWVNA